MSKVLYLSTNTVWIIEVMSFDLRKFFKYEYIFKRERARDEISQSFFAQASFEYCEVQPISQRSEAKLIYLKLYDLIFWAER